MTHGSLFSGIGGFDLAAQWMGWDNRFHCEIEDFPRKVLTHYWPEATSYEDITKTDFTIHRGGIDVLTGGFPCQPFSQAGKQEGTSDHRHLWPQMLRAIREIAPRWIVGENVHGLVNMSEGLVLESIISSLEHSSYEVLTFEIPALGVNAPHRRKRVWIIAHACGDGQQLWRPRQDRRTEGESKSEGNKRERVCNDAGGDVQPSDSTNATRSRRIQTKWKGEPEQPIQNDGAECFKNFPTQSPICDGDDGFSARLDGITFPKWRNESIKAGGNAIVPQIAHNIFQAIQDYEDNI